MNDKEQVKTAEIIEQSEEKLTNWWKFQITDEQAAAWLQGDLNAAKRFFEENDKLLRGIAKRYFKQAVTDMLPSWFYGAITETRRYYELEDAIHQIYNDLLDYRFFDGKTLYNCIMRSCVYVCNGGYKSSPIVISCNASFDAPFSDDEDGTLADMIADVKTIDDYIEYSPTMVKAFEGMLDKIAKTIYPGKKNELKRLAFIRRF